MKRYIFQIINNKIKASKDNAQRLYSGNYKLFFVNFSNTCFLLSSDWTSVFATFFRSSLSVLFLWKLRIKMELKQNESIVDIIHNCNRNTENTDEEITDTNSLVLLWIFQTTTFFLFFVIIYGLRRKLSLISWSLNIRREYKWQLGKTY